MQLPESQPTPTRCPTFESLRIWTHGRDPTDNLVAENRRVLRNSPVIVQDGEGGVTHTAMFDSYFNLLWSDQSEIDGFDHQRLLRCLRNTCPMLHRYPAYLFDQQATHV